MFVDTSVVVAILAGEPDAAYFAAKLESAPTKLSAPHVVLEASMRLATLLGVDPRRAEAAIAELFAEAGIEQVAIDAEDGREAVAALAAYGRGRGHPARLNFGDCLSYACARRREVPLLFKGEDFSATDIARA